MKPILKRALSVAAAAGFVAVAAPLLAAAPAVALGSLQGAATLSVASGNSSTAFSLNLPAGAACPGDSTNDGYRWQTYMVPSSVDPATLTFGSAGPITPAVGASFRQPLYTTAGSPIVNKQTADKTPPATVGPILGVPAMNLAVFAPGNIPTGVYNLGVACTLGPASATQMNFFWNAQMTVLKNANGGPAQVNWKAGNVQAAPDAPTISSVTASAVIPATGQASVVFSVPEAVPAVSGCKLFVGTTAGGSEFSSASIPCTSPQVVTGLTYGQGYFFRVTSSNSVGSSAASNEVSATAVRPAVTGLSATPGAAASIAVDWADAPLLAAGEQYNIVVAGVGGTFHSATSNISFAGSPGSTYTFTVTYGAAGTSLAASTSAKAKCNVGVVSGLVSNSLPPLEAVACLVGKLGL